MCVITTEPARQRDQSSELSLIPQPKIGKDLAVTGAAISSLALREGLQAERRADQQRHHHRQIWTKDPHGGPYKKASNSEGYDPLTQMPDGREKVMPLGYEKTELGPTTNFVGNHMTQGAIDLVQADLDEPPASSESTPRLSNVSAAGPLRLSSGYTDALASNAPRVQQIEHYGWEECQETIRLSISLAIPSASAATAGVDGGFKSNSFWLTVQHSASDGASDIQHSLTVPHFFGAIKPQQSHLQVSFGQQAKADLPGSSSSSCSREIVMRQQSSSDQECAVLVMVLLVKQDPQQHWPSLTQGKEFRQVLRQMRHAEQDSQLRQLRQAARQLRAGSTRLQLPGSADSSKLLQDTAKAWSEAAAPETSSCSAEDVPAPLSDGAFQNALDEACQAMDRAAPVEADSAAKPSDSSRHVSYDHAALIWQRAVALEQLERYEDSLRDLLWLRSHSKGFSLQAMRAIERVKRSQQGMRHWAEAETSLTASSCNEGTLLPHHGMAAFRHRGKAGAIF
ncbi:hypothetical protein WJX74_003543 [Apatococcus lobatus]|uniref:CS domain-containing protein n=1 Tax=Apatococcus lobatus TaxID=904363 RepID=A0AAW1QH71_9CHLO